MASNKSNQGTKGAPKSLEQAMEEAIALLQAPPYGLQGLTYKGEPTTDQVLSGLVNLGRQVGAQLASHKITSQHAAGLSTKISGLREEIKLARKSEKQAVKPGAKMSSKKQTSLEDPIAAAIPLLRKFGNMVSGRPTIAQALNGLRKGQGDLQKRIREENNKPEEDRDGNKIEHWTETLHQTKTLIGLLAALQANVKQPGYIVESGQSNGTIKPIARERISAALNDPKRAFGNALAAAAQKMGWPNDWEQQRVKWTTAIRQHDATETGLDMEAYRVGRKIVPQHIVNAVVAVISAWNSGSSSVIYTDAVRNAAERSNKAIAEANQEKLRDAQEVRKAAHEAARLKEERRISKRASAAGSRGTAR